MRLAYRDAVFLLMELTALFLFLFVLFFSVVQVSVFGPAPYRFSSSPTDYAVLALLGALLVGLHAASRKHAPAAFAAKHAASRLVLETARKKLYAGVEDPRVPALLLIELSYVALIALALDAYVDPEKELVAWSLLGLEPPVTTVLNFLLFVAVTGAALALYAMTRGFRVARKQATEGKDAAAPAWRARKRAGKRP